MIKSRENPNHYIRYLTPCWETEKDFSSYFKQIALIKKVFGCELESNKEKFILEVWPWTHFTTDYLRKLWYNVDTFDYFEKFNPTYIWDVREIDKIVKRKYDLVVCFEVLEHLPFKDFIPTLKKFSNISDKVIISLPRPSFNLFRIMFRFPYLKKDIKISFNIPLFWKQHNFDG